MTPIQIINRLLAWFDKPAHWNKKAYGQTSGYSADVHPIIADSTCIIGGLLRVTGGNTEQDLREKCPELVTLFVSLVPGSSHSIIDPFRRLVTWNDSPTTKFQDIRHLLITAKAELSS